MKLKTIYEAYDKNLGNSVAKKYNQDPTTIKAWVQTIDPNYTHAPWILKQLKENTPTSQLQDELKQLITKFKNATEHTPNTLISTDINKYTLESLRSALDTYEIRGEFQPESLDGVTKLRDFNVTTGFGTTEGVKTQIRAYLITNPTSLTELSKDKGWCVKATGTAKEHIAKTPVIMIFRNNEATALGDIIGSQLMNSQNKPMGRIGLGGTEVIQLIKELKNDNNIMKLLSKNPGWAYKYACVVINGRWPEGEQAIIKNQELAYRYAKDVIKGRWPEAEEIISTNPALAYDYAKIVIKGRWPEGEQAISKNTQWASQYAKSVIKGRWPEGEQAISTDPYLAYEYARDNNIKGRWPEAEKTISKNPEWAYNYAADIIRERWPEAEEAISTNPGWAYRYARDIIKGRWPEAEHEIRTDPKWAYEYARDIIKGRWPEAEEAISTNPGWAYRYARDIIKGRWPEGEQAINQDPHWASKYARSYPSGWVIDGQKQE